MTKAVMQLILWLLVCLMIVGCQTSEAQRHTPSYRVEYFAGLAFWESPIQVLRAESPLSAEHARTRTHIRVAYDEMNRMREFSFRLGDHVKDIEGSFGNFYLHAPMTRIKYEDNKEIHTFYDRLGNQIDGWGVHKKIYHKDALGRYTRLDFADKEGNGVANSWGIAYYQWQHQLDGSVVETRFDENGALQIHSPGFDVKRVKLTFSPNGQLALMQNIDEEGNLIPAESGASQYKYYYNKRGQFARWEIYDAEDQPAIGPTGTSGEYNEFQGIEHRAIVFFDRDRRPTLHTSGAATWQKKHDEFGNVIEVFYTDLSGKPTENIRGVGKNNYQYSDDGLFLIGQQFYDAEGQLTNHTAWGFAQIRLTRDGRGLIQKREYLDRHGNLANRKDNGVAYISYQYTPAGLLVSQQNFDVSGRLVS